MNKTCNPFHSPYMLQAPLYHWPLKFWISRLWWDKTEEISFLRFKAVISLMCTIFKKYFRINPLLPINLITKIINNKLKLLSVSLCKSTMKRWAVFFFFLFISFCFFCFCFFLFFFVFYAFMSFFFAFFFVFFSFHEFFLFNLVC